MDYKNLLKKAMKDMPESVFEKHRFEIPKVRGHLQGNRTVISNLVQIAGHLRRKPEHLLKYLLKELATPGALKNNMVIFGAKVSATKVNEKIQKFANEFVLCSECGKPDTVIEKDNAISYLKCTACGAKHVVRA
jgi:translation initiation factor 2 subunit 2